MKRGKARAGWKGILLGCGGGKVKGPRYVRASGFLACGGQKSQ